MLSKITDRIYIGDAGEAMNFSRMAENGITAILNVAWDLSDKANWRDFEVAHCGLNDSPGNPITAYYSAIFGLHNLLSKGHTVMVHCQAGISRSPFVVLAYLRSTDFIKRELSKERMSVSIYS